MVAASGQIVVDLGPFPGVTDTEVTIAGLTGIADASQVDAWVQPADVTAGFGADGVPVNPLVYMTRGANFTGAADSKLGIYSVWVYPEFSWNQMIFLAAAGMPGWTEVFRIFRNTGFDFVASQSVQFAFTFIGSLDEGGGRRQAWRHALASWDIGANVGSLWVDDMLLDATLNRALDAAVPYSTATDWKVGDINPAGSSLSGRIAEHYFNPGQYLDFTVEANRRKFSTIVAGELKPVDLGSDGSLPTGTVPILYQHIGAGEACANFLTNRGSGGNLALTATTGNPVAQLPSFGLGLGITPGHSVDEHVLDAPLVRAYSPSAAGASMKVRLSAPYNAKLAAARVNPSDVPRLCGRWNLGWAWS